MENKKLSPLLGGLIGGGIILVLSVLLMLLSAALFLGRDNPVSYVILAACLSLGVASLLGGYISGRLSGLMTGCVYACIMALILMACGASFIPNDEADLVTRVAPPLCVALPCLAGGYFSTVKKAKSADEIRKRVKKRIKN